MKSILIIFLIFLTNSSWASYHFLCLKKLNDNQYEKKPSLMLMPIKAELSSNAILSLLNSDNKSIDFKYSKDLSQKDKNRYTFLNGPEGTQIRIDSKGVIREMMITKNVKNILNFNLIYRCEMESSI